MHNESRRSLIKAMALTGAGVLAPSAFHSAHAGSTADIKANRTENGMKQSSLKGNINHSVSRWTYGDLSIEELCNTVKELNFSAIDLVGPEDWPVLKQHGIDSSMCNGAEISLEDGFIHSELHDELEARYLKHIDLVADAGYTNQIGRAHV